MAESDTRDDAGRLIRQRYRLERSIGQGGQARTFLATDEQTGGRVVVKILLVEHVDDWKATELFEREAEALRKLDHPRVPDYVDYFQEHPDSGESRYCLVQEYVRGDSLATLIDEGIRFDEAEARRFARQMLEVLDYLHDREPPVLHRDIKPSNIVRRPDDEYVLVDFGGVRVALPDEKGGATIIGSHGYMPHEQLLGRADPASDLYALGATLVHLLSGKDPSGLTDDMTIEFRDHVNVTEEFNGFLDALVEPTVEARVGTADRALELLEGDGEPSDDRDFEGDWAPDCPRLTIERGENVLELRFDRRPFAERCNHWTQYLLSSDHGLVAHLAPTESPGLVFEGVMWLVVGPLAAAYVATTYPLLFVFGATPSFDSGMRLREMTRQVSLLSPLLVFVGVWGLADLLWLSESSLAPESKLPYLRVFAGMGFAFVGVFALVFAEALVNLWRRGGEVRRRVRANLEDYGLVFRDDSYEWQIGGETVRSGPLEELRGVESATHPEREGESLQMVGETDPILLPDDLSIRDRERLRPELEKIIGSGGGADDRGVWEYRESG